MWTPPARCSPPPHLDVLYLLVLGAQRPAIAQDLRLRARTVDQRVAEIQRAVGAVDRFGLGVDTIRQRLINPVYLVGHASARRADAEWVLPTIRQYEFLRLRSNGSSVDQVAAKTGMSASSVRQQLARLATRNGAGNAGRCSSRWAGRDLPHRTTRLRARPVRSLIPAHPAARTVGRRTTRSVGDCGMRKLVVGEFISLDGVVQAPGAPDEDRDGGFTHGGWTVPLFDEELGEIMTELVTGAGGLLHGRRTRASPPPGRCSATTTRSPRP